MVERRPLTMTGIGSSAGPAGWIHRFGEGTDDIVLQVVASASEGSCSLDVRSRDRPGGQMGRRPRTRPLRGRGGVAAELQHTGVVIETCFEAIERLDPLSVGAHAEAANPAA